MTSIVVAPSASADTQTARTWAGAADLAGPEGLVRQPTFKATLRRSGPISVARETFDDGQQAMSAATPYGNDTRDFSIGKTCDGFASAIDAMPERCAAPVGTFTG